MSEELVHRDEVATRWAEAAASVEQSLQQRLAVAFLGSASAGKDAAIRALFGIDFGEVDPIPGSTDRIRVAPLDPERRVLLVNAPGFGDVRGHVDALARRALDSLDIAVYLVNADGGASIDERRDLDAVRDLGRPVLVCINKIDLIRPHQREEFVRTTLAQLGVDEADAVVTAFDPLPALADAPIGVEEVTAWIHRRLAEDGKDLLFAKYLRSRASACEVIIKTAARNAAMAGAVPIPGADFTAVTALQVKLISDIAAVHGARMDRDAVFFILGEVLAGTGKGFIRWGVEALKAGGWIPGAQIAQVATSALGATLAGASTYGVGRAAVSFIQANQKMTGDQLRTVFDREAHAWRSHQT